MLQSLTDIRYFVTKKEPQGLIIDTDILVLLLVGIYDANFISECELFSQNNKHYSIDDFVLLKKVIAFFKEKIVITPQIIAEISSNANKVGGNRQRPYFRVVIDFLKLVNVTERYQRIDSLWKMGVEIICDFRFTDLTMLELSKQEKLPILTDEIRFFEHSLKEGATIIKFEHIKNFKYQEIVNLKI